MVKKYLFILCLFLFVGCEVEPKQGMVIDKIFEPAREEKVTQLEPSIGIGWDGKLCTHWNTVNRVIHRPDIFSIIVTGQGSSKRIYLNKQDYDSFKLGDHYPHYEKPENEK